MDKEKLEEIQFNIESLIKQYEEMLNNLHAKHEFDLIHDLMNLKELFHRQQNRVMYQ